MEASASNSGPALSVPAQRVSYVLPRPECETQRLALPEIGAGRAPSRVSRKGSSNPYVLPHPSAASSGAGAKQDATQSTHPRHALSVTGLAIDPSTAVLDGDSRDPVPRGLLYTAGRDGLVCSWELGLKMRKRRRFNDVAGGAGADIAETGNEDEDDADNNENDEEEWILSDRPQDERAPSPTSLPFERQWQVDPDWLRENGPHNARPVTQFRSCVQSHTDWINDMVLCNSNQTVVTASSDRFVRLWSPHHPTASTSPAVLGSHTDYVKSLAYPSASSHSPQWIASGGLDRRIRLWDLGEVRRDPIVELHDSQSIYCINTDARGGLLAAGTPDSSIGLYDPRSPSRSGPIGRLLGHTDMVRSLILSQSGRKMLSASSDGTVRLWDVAEQRLMHTYTYHSTSVTALHSASDDLAVFYSGDRDGYVCKVDSDDCVEPDDGECIVLAKSSGPINKLVALDDSFVWTSGYGSNVQCWRDVPSRADRQQWYPIQHDRDGDYDGEFGRDDGTGTGVGGPGTDLESYSLTGASTPATPATPAGGRRDWTRFSIDTFRSDSPSSTTAPKFGGGDDSQRPRLQSALKTGSSFGFQQQQQAAPVSSDATATDSAPPATPPSAAPGMTPHVSFSLGRGGSPSTRSGTPQRHPEETQRPARPPPLAPDVNEAATLFGIPFDSLVSLATDEQSFGATGLSTGGGVATGLGSIASNRAGGSTVGLNRRLNDGRRGSSFSLRRTSFALENFGSSPDVPPAMARLAQLRIASHQAQMQQREMAARRHQAAAAAAQPFQRYDHPPIDEASSASASPAQSPTQTLLVRQDKHQSTRSASSIRFAAAAGAGGGAAAEGLRSGSQLGHGDGDETEQDEEDACTRSRIAYEERDIALKATPFTATPCDVIRGTKGLIRSSVLNDRRHVLTFASSADGLRTCSSEDESSPPEIALWDIVRGMCIGHFDTAEVLALSSYGDTPGDILEKVKERIEGQGAGAAWCTVDTSCGSLTVHLEFPSVFDTEAYLDECDWISAEMHLRSDQRANLGKWILRWLFSGFVDAEVSLREGGEAGLAPRLATGQLAIEQQAQALASGGKTGVGGDAQGPLGNTVGVAVAPKTPAIGPAEGASLLAPALSPAFPAIASLAEAVNSAAATATSTTGATSTAPGASDYFNSKGGEATAHPSTPGGKSLGGGNASSPAASAASPGGSTLMGRWGSRFSRSNTNKGSGIGAASGSSKDNAGGGAAAVDVKAGAAADAKPIADAAPTDPPSVSLARTVLARGITPPAPGEVPELPLPANTAILISSHSSDAAPWETVFRGLKSSTSQDVAMLELAAPAWLLETVLNNRIGVSAERVAATKVTFVLTPYGADRSGEGEGETVGGAEGDEDEESALPPLPSGDARLTATRWLRIGKTAAFVCEKLGYVRVSKSRQASIAALSRRPSADDGPQQQQEASVVEPPSPRPSSSTTGSQQMEQLTAQDIELLCNGQVLDADMTLAQIARYVYRGSSANPIPLEYRRRAVAAAVSWTQGYSPRQQQQAHM